MAARGETKLFTGVRGLITEAPPTNFPVNAVTDILNCDIGIDGSITTRAGLQQEADGVAISSISVGGGSIELPPFAEAVTEIRENWTWKDVGGQAALNLEVIRVGLRFFIFQHNTTMSASPLWALDIEGTSFVVDTVLAKESTFSTAVGNGRIYMANPGCEPFYLELNAGVIGINEVDIEIRDFDGVDDGLAADTRPSTLTAEHNYNLQNQGWPTTAVPSVNDRAGSGVTTTAPIGWTKTKLGVYPSNADFYGFAKAEAADTTAAVGAFSPFALENLALGNTQVARGHFIYDAFNIDRSSFSLGSTTTDKRPAAVTFYAGRAWWAGVQSENYSNVLFFGQSGEDPLKAGRCYQDADPTADEINDLVATDGGSIPIQGMGTVIAMGTIRQFLVVFATNGVWSVSGVEGSSFDATNVSVSKVSDNGATTANNIVELDGSFYYFGQDAIHRITTGDNIGTILAEENLTEATIKSFFVNISTDARAACKGKSSLKERKVYWAYNSDLEADLRNFDSMLILDLNTSSFTKYALGEQSDMRIFDMFNTDTYTRSVGQDVLTTNDGEGITLNDGNTLVTTDAQTSLLGSVAKRIKVCGIVDNGASAAGLFFGEFSSDTYRDWTDRTEVDYDHYFDLGFNDMGSVSRAGAPVYVNSFFARDLALAPLTSQSEVAPVATEEAVRVNQVYVQVVEKL